MFEACERPLFVKKQIVRNTFVVVAHVCNYESVLYSNNVIRK